MNKITRYLHKLRKIKRKKYHPIMHRLKKKYKISRKTLFYVKEYGAGTNVPVTILKESLKILVFASLISSLGGLALEHIKNIFISIVPLVILLPVLNDMIGDYGIIASSRFSTLLYTGKIRGKIFKNEELRKLFFQILFVAMITAIISSTVSLILSYISGFGLNYNIAGKIFLISIIDVIVIVSFLFLIAIKAGLYVYKKGEDPDNFLIPITTSIADFANMFILTILVMLFF